MEGYNPQQFGAVPGLALEAADDMIVVTDLMRAARAMVIGALAVRGGEGTFAVQDPIYDMTEDLV